MLAVPPAKDDKQAYSRYCAGLDALIRLDGKAPTTLVAAAAAIADIRIRTQALILAARDPLANRDALLGMLDQDGTDAEWLAICELLDEQRPMQLAEHLLRGLSLTLKISVHDPGRIGGSRHRSVSRYGASVITFPDGYPPFALYYCTTAQEEGGVVLTSGFQTVLWVRAEIDRSGGYYCKGDVSLDRDAARIFLLARMTRPWSLPDLEPTKKSNLEWQDAATFTAEATLIYAHICSEQQALVSELVKEGVLPKVEMDRFPARITATIEDIRQHASAPLPALPFAQPAVRSGQQPQP